MSPTGIRLSSRLRICFRVRFRLLAAPATLFVLALAHEIVGRALFYVLVTPTTMPGAFFWNNKYFEAHARKTGLANMPQVGVVPDIH